MRLTIPERLLSITKFLLALACIAATPATSFPSVNSPILTVCGIPLPVTATQNAVNGNEIKFNEYTLAPDARNRFWLLSLQGEAKVPFGGAFPGQPMQRLNQFFVNGSHLPLTGQALEKFSGMRISVTGTLDSWLSQSYVIVATSIHRVAHCNAAP